MFLLPQTALGTEARAFIPASRWRLWDRVTEPAERLEGEQPESPPSVYGPGFLFISFHTEKRRKVYFYAVYSNAQRVIFPGAPSLIISSRINTAQLRNFRVDPIKEILHSARARAN